MECCSSYPMAPYDRVKMMYDFYFLFNQRTEEIFRVSPHVSYTVVKTNVRQVVWSPESPRDS